MSNAGIIGTRAYAYNRALELNLTRNCGQSIPFGFPTFLTLCNALFRLHFSLTTKVSKGNQISDRIIHYYQQEKKLFAVGFNQKPHNPPYKIPIFTPYVMREHSAIHANSKGPARSHVELTINPMMKITVLKLSDIQRPSLLAEFTEFTRYLVYPILGCLWFAPQFFSLPRYHSIPPFHAHLLVLPTTRRTDRLNLICYAMSILVKAEYYLYMGSDWHVVGFEIRRSSFGILNPPHAGYIHAESLHHALWVEDLPIITRILERLI
jgi:hypothetical protein